MDVTMTQDDADLIYNYLHEHFEYKEGDFYRIKPIHGSQIGRKMGALKIHPDGSAYLVGAFNINGKSYNKRIAHLVYLYHHKELPLYIRYLDKNKTNTKIENLKKTRLRQSNIQPRKFKQGSGTKYKINVIINGKEMFLGSYSKEEYANKAIEIIENLACDYSFPDESFEDKAREAIGLPPRKVKLDRILPEGIDISKGRFRARIRHNGSRLNLGSYKTASEAREAYLNAKMELKNK